jgi:trehalose utilization protein
VDDQRDGPVRRLYPDGMHGEVATAIAAQLGGAAAVRTATLDQPDNGLPHDVLAATDVLVWWGHVAHDQVDDDVVDEVVRRVLEDGMGLVVLHSGHYSKPFRQLLGTTCSLRWRESEDREVVWTVAPGHPVARDLPQGFVIPAQETYSEFFDIPVPDELVFVSSFSGGEVFRSGCGFRRGNGRVFYFSPGHETYPVFHQEEVQRVIANAVVWAVAGDDPPVRTDDCIHSPTGWFEPERGHGLP